MKSDMFDYGIADEVIERATERALAKLISEGKMRELILDETCKEMLQNYKDILS